MSEGLNCENSVISSGELVVGFTYACSTVHTMLHFEEGIENMNRSLA